MMTHANLAMMISSYDLRIVAVSILIAIVAAHVALDLAGRVTASKGRARFLWLTGGAVSMGIGIWSMHFVGMLAFSLPISVTYYVPTVILSLVAAILASLVALFVVKQLHHEPVPIIYGQSLDGCRHCDHALYGYGCHATTSHHVL